jgi:hypothetical protein
VADDPPQVLSRDVDVHEVERNQIRMHPRQGPPLLPRLLTPRCENSPPRSWLGGHRKAPMYTCYC